MIKPEIIQQALDEISKRFINYKYFFDHLKSPDWIDPLFAKGFFQKPPPGIKEGESIYFPFWPESQYLVRMAPVAPDKVLDVILKIPDTNNVRVHEDLSDAACSLPPRLAARWVIKEIKWIDSQQYLYFLLPEKIGNVIHHLALGKQAPIALSLAKSLLAILPDPRTEKGEKDLFYNPKPRARFDYWDYEQITNKILPVLIQTSGEDALRLFCDLLVTAVKSTMSSAASQGPEDYSHIWRHAVEADGFDEIENLLVSAVRNAGESLIPEKGSSVLKIIEKRPFKVFQRIGLHLRWKFYEVDPRGTADLIIHPDLFYVKTIHHEYFNLIRDHFKNFPDKTRQTYYDLVSGMNNTERWLSPEILEQFNEKQITRYVRKQRYLKLLPIREYLDQGWKSNFEELVKEFGVIDRPDIDTLESKVWVGPTSPKDLEALKSMSVEDIVSFLKSWQPSGNMMSPSGEGLRRELTELISSEPERFSSSAEHFKECHPTYARGLLLGLRDAATKGRRFQWPPVITLCNWIIQQPREISGPKGRFYDLDPDWSWTLKAIANLFSVGFDSGKAEIPIEFRASVWEVVKPITNDPDPTLEKEAKYNGSVMDPTTISINSTRGEAMLAVIKYGLWVRRNLKKMDSGNGYTDKPFNDISEIQEVLEQHLDTNIDPSPAIRSVYGRTFPWLEVLDSRWAAKMVTKIFPLDQSQQILYDAAWGAYIVFCRPYDNIFELLQEQYSHEVDQISNTPKDKSDISKTHKRLAEHLVVFYYRGKIDFNDPDGILKRFYDNAPIELTSHAFEFIGRSFQQTRESIDSRIIDRLKSLWQWRLEVIKGFPSINSMVSELTEFGWWFASGKFEDTWAITQLKEVLNLAKEIKADGRVVERLAILSPEMPLITVECLSVIMKADTHRWPMSSWEKYARSILSNSLECNDERPRRVALDLINYLAARGDFSFQDLIVG